MSLTDQKTLEKIKQLSTTILKEHKGLVTIQETQDHYRLMMTVEIPKKAEWKIFGALSYNGNIASGH